MPWPRGTRPWRWRVLGQLIFLKLYRLATLARTSEYEQALIELDPLAVQARASGEALFEVARIYTIAAQKAATDAKQSPAERTRRSDDAAERAVENLRLAQAKGFFAGPEAPQELPGPQPGPGFPPQEIGFSEIADGRGGGGARHALNSSKKYFTANPKPIAITIHRTAARGKRRP